MDLFEAPREIRHRGETTVDASSSRRSGVLGVRDGDDLETVDAAENRSDPLRPLHHRVYAALVEVRAERDLTLVHPFDDPPIVAGYDRGVDCG